MYAKHDLKIFTPPKHQNAIIWRYLEFTKFLSTLEKQALYFTSVSRLFKSDKFEGSIPIKNFEHRKEILEELPAEIRNSAFKGVSSFYKDVKNFTFVNCWTCFRHEIAALWNIYVKSNDGIAIKSTYRRLKESIEKDNNPTFIGMVKYIDYEKDVFPENNFLNLVMYKRKSFQFERELRALIVGADKRNEPGMLVKVDLERLINEIYVSPEAEDWFLELVRSIVKKYNLTIEPKRSNLDSDPVY